MRTIIISPDADLARHLSQALQMLGDQLLVTRVVTKYPEAVELTSIMRVDAFEVIFLDYQDATLATAIVKHIESEINGVQTVAIHRTCEPGLLRETMRAGIQEFLAYPFDQYSVVETVRNVRDMLDRNPVVYSGGDQILAFLPSKAGVGATTLALNVAGALAAKDGRKVALTDFDLNSGMLRFLLHLENEYSITDAIKGSAKLDEKLWSALTTAQASLDVVHAGRVNPSIRIEPAQIHSLVRFMRRHYEVLCFDLSGNLERYSIELMLETTKVLMVCTPEVASLHLAQEKITYLHSQGLDGRISVLLNRTTRQSIGKSQVEDLLGVKVLQSFSNDYNAVTAATTSAKLLQPTSVIGKQCTEFAASLLQNQSRKQDSQTGRKFLEYFSLHGKSEHLKHRAS